MREEASTRAVSLGRVRVFAQDRVALMSTRPRRIRNLHTSRAYQIARGLVPRSAPNPERECVCVFGELFFGEGGESAEFAQDRGGKSR